MKTRLWCWPQPEEYSGPVFVVWIPQQYRKTKTFRQLCVCVCVSRWVTKFSFSTHSVWCVRTINGRLSGAATYRPHGCSSFHCTQTTAHIWSLWCCYFFLFFVSNGKIDLYPTNVISSNVIVVAIFFLEGKFSKAITSKYYSMTYFGFCFQVGFWSLWQVCFCFCLQFVSNSWYTNHAHVLETRLLTPSLFRRFRVWFLHFDMRAFFTVESFGFD